MLTGAHPGDLPAAQPLLSLEGGGVTLEAVKRAEDSDKLVVRVVERHGGQASVAIRPAGPPLNAAAECNLLEQDAVPVELDGETLMFEIRPYEIRTFILG